MQFEALTTPEESLAQAFSRAVAQAGWDHGHSGYTGSLAEKGEVVLIPVSPGPGLPPTNNGVDYKTALAEADRLIQEGDERVDDKWGPAGAIRVKGPGFLTRKGPE